MSGFRTGGFDREKAGIYRHFCPVRAVDLLTDVDLGELYAQGKKLLLVDVDNTLVEWRSEEIPQSTVDWINHAHELGMKVCVLSNTRHKERLHRLAGRLSIDYLLGKFKPSRFMYHKALEKFGFSAEEAIMVGDQIFTDILGANRSGIEAIWVRQMAPKDLILTKVSRLGERIIRGRLYKALMEEEVKKEAAGDDEEDLPVGGTAAFEMLKSPVVRQFVKFCIVGGSSTVVDVGLHWLLMFKVPYQGGLLRDAVGQSAINAVPWLFGHFKSASDAAAPLFKILTGGIAIVNSFFWNRHWTFEIRGKEHRSVQFRKFLVIALIGVALNTVILGVLNASVPGHEQRSWAVATVVATVVVAFWNFLGQKLWTFKHKH